MSNAGNQLQQALREAAPFAIPEDVDDGTELDIPPALADWAFCEVQSSQIGTEAQPRTDATPEAVPGVADGQDDFNDRLHEQLEVVRVQTMELSRLEGSDLVSHIANLLSEARREGQREGQQGLEEAVAEVEARAAEAEARGEARGRQGGIAEGRAEGETIGEFRGSRLAKAAQKEAEVARKEAEVARKEGLRLAEVARQEGLQEGLREALRQQRQMRPGAAAQHALHEAFLKWSAVASEEPSAWRNQRRIRLPIAPAAQPEVFVVTTLQRLRFGTPSNLMVRIIFGLWWRRLSAMGFPSAQVWLASLDASVDWTDWMERLELVEGTELFNTDEHISDTSALEDLW